MRLSSDFSCVLSWIFLGNSWRVTVATGIPAHLLELEWCWVREDLWRWEQKHVEESFVANEQMR